MRIITEELKRELFSLVEEGKVKQVAGIVKELFPEFVKTRMSARRFIADILNANNGLGGFHPVEISGGFVPNSEIYRW